MGSSRFLFLFALCLSAAAPIATTACTTVTTIRSVEGDASALEPPADDSTPNDPSTDGGTTSDDGGTPGAKDSGRSDSGRPPPPDSGGPVQVGGSITVKCPSSGFHAGPPITIASVPSAHLPRCSSATRACYVGAATAAAADACLSSDTTPPATIAGEAVDCMQCERTQGSYCMASACKSEFGAYACCVQAQGSAKCAAELDAVSACAGSSGKPAFETCLNALIPRCFQMGLDAHQRDSSASFPSGLRRTRRALRHRIERSRSSSP